jgi:hypothetical protein
MSARPQERCVGQMPRIRGGDELGLGTDYCGVVSRSSSAPRARGSAAVAAATPEPRANRRRPYWFFFWFAICSAIDLFIKGTAAVSVSCTLRLLFHMSPNLPSFCRTLMAAWP